jgi:hypothetical protein
MTAGSGSEPEMQITLVRLEPIGQADLRTAIEVEKSTAQGWEAIARLQWRTIEHLRLCLQRYSKRSPN